MWSVPCVCQVGDAKYFFSYFHANANMIFYFFRLDLFLCEDLIERNTTKKANTIFMAAIDLRQDNLLNLVIVMIFENVLFHTTILTIQNNFSFPI